MNQDFLVKYTSVITRCPLFSGMDPETLDRAMEVFRAVSLSCDKGSFPHLPGEPMLWFGLVLEGTVLACADDLEGNRMIMAEVTPGQTFGEALWYLKTKDSPVYICAPENALLLRLSPDFLFQPAQDSFSLEMKSRFTAMLARRTLQMNSRIQILSKLTLRDKLMAYFSQLSAASGRESFTVPMSREDMAVWLGCNRSALSRELSALKAEGKIDFTRNRFRILRN